MCKIYKTQNIKMVDIHRFTLEMELPRTFGKKDQDMAASTRAHREKATVVLKEGQWISCIKPVVFKRS